MSWLTQDLQRAVRLVRQTPWFAGGVIFLLALGTGLNSAVLTTTYGILLRPLPYDDPSRLAILQHRIPLRQIVEWRQRLQSVDDVAAFATADHSIRGFDEPRIVRAAFVSQSFFRVLGARPVAGRTFGDGDVPGVVVSQRLVDASSRDVSSVIGSTVNIAEGAFVVVGVLPRDVAVPSETTDVWLPAEAAAAIPVLRADARRYDMLIRLKHGVTLDYARDDAARMARDLGANVTQVPVVSLDARLRDEARPVLLALTVSAVLVLLVTCANVASLLLSRTAARERETAMRLALGASPFRVLRTLFVEGLLFAIAGSAFGIALAIGGVRLLRTHASALVPRLDAVRVDDDAGARADNRLARRDALHARSRLSRTSTRPEPGDSPGRTGVRPSRAPLDRRAGRRTNRTLDRGSHRRCAARPHGNALARSRCRRHARTRADHEADAR